MRKFEEYYVALWCLLMPVTSLLVIPSIQGTIPAYLLAFGSTMFICLRTHALGLPRQVSRYILALFGVSLIWVLFFVGSQFGNLLHPDLNISRVTMISPDTTLLIRSSMFTQSLYFLACVLVALYFRYLFRDDWMKYVFWGAWFVSLYGLYEWTFFLVFQRPGDFIANRMFGDHPGSWTQTISFGGLQVMRLKSTVGEPSFYSAVVIPYLFLALEHKKKILSAVLVLTALLSTSTSVYLGMAMAFVIQAFWSKKGRIASCVALAVLLASLLAMYLLFPDTFQSLFYDKFSGQNDSGKIRLANIDSYTDLIENFSFMNWMFGLGFGYTYFTIPWAQVVNTGLLGLSLLFYVFLKPAWRLPRGIGYGGLKISMLALVILFALTLSELYIPTIWMVLGLAYRKLDELKAKPQPAVTPPLPVRAEAVAVA